MTPAEHPASQTSPADELRKAAAKLREAVAAVPPSPWETWTSDGGTLVSVVSTDPAARARSGRRRVIVRSGIADSTNRASVAYVTLMQPSVAESLAAWLDSVLAEHEREERIKAKYPPDSAYQQAAPQHWDEALAVARAILSGAAS